MRNIRIIIHLSLDGVAKPEGDTDYSNGGWMVPFRSVDGREIVTEAHKGRDLLLGRKTYDQFAGFWPNAGDNPIANALNSATKYVATHSPENLTWGPVGNLGADIMKGISELRSTQGPDLLVIGSMTLTSALLKEGLFDELLMIVYPITLGRGLRFFAEGVDARELALVSTKTTSRGVLLNTYRPVGPLRAP